VTLDHFYGIEIDEWPARIAETAMFLIDRQCDLKLTASLGWAPDRLPIQEQPPSSSTTLSSWTGRPSAHLRGQVSSPATHPSSDDHTRTNEQLVDLTSRLGHKDLSRLDYVTGWHAKVL
jgi:hypothetical protein